METLLLIALVGILFYVLLPGFGAFFVRSLWRRFRKMVEESSKYPIVRYENLRDRNSGFLGNFRFFGNLEAIQGDQIWVRNGSITVSAKLERGSVYILPSCSFSRSEKVYERNEETLPDEAPAKVQWKKIFSLPRGTKMLISGPLYNKKGQAVFQWEGEGNLLVMIYDGGEETILRRSIWGGRQRNEYWNLFTPGSLTVGSFSLFIIGYSLLRESIQRLPALIAFSMSLLPILMLFPPGLFLFFIYRYFWRQGRFYRAERDILLLPLRFFSEENPCSARETFPVEVRLPGGGTYRMERFEKKQDIPVDVYARGATIRTTSLLTKTDIDKDGWYLFSVDGYDPMAELVIIPGNPEVLSRRCRGRARIYELISALLFATGLFINVIILFVILSRLIG